MLADIKYLPSFCLAHFLFPPQYSLHCRNEHLVPPCKQDAEFYPTPDKNTQIDK